MAPNASSFNNPLSLTLDVIGPKPGATRGEPVESVKVLHEDPHSQAGIWECTPGAFVGRRDGYREVFTVLAGAGVLRDEALECWQQSLRDVCDVVDRVAGSHEVSEGLSSCQPLDAEELQRRRPHKDCAVWLRLVC